MFKETWKRFAFYLAFLTNAFLLGFSLSFDDQILFKIASVSTIALLLSWVLNSHVQEENKQHD